LIWANKPEPPICRDIQVFYLYGATGTGKTHRAYTVFPKAFKVAGKYYEGKSFDMYDGEAVLILDEWSPYEWPLTLMNSLLQKWECRLQCRYENKYAYWTKVIICTNFKPEECYTSVLALQRATFDRRLTFKIEIITQHDPVVDFETGSGLPTVPNTPDPLIIPGRDDCASQLPDPDAGIIVPATPPDQLHDEPPAAAYAPPDVLPYKNFMPTSLYAYMHKHN